MNVLDIMKALDPVGTNGKADDVLNVYISLALPRLSYCVWGALYNQGVALLALHLLNLASVRSRTAASGAAGPVTMEIAGRVTLQYGKSESAGGGTLGTTPWGQEFMELAKKLPGRRAFNTGFRLEDLCDPDPKQMGESN